MCVLKMETWYILIVLISEAIAVLAKGKTHTMWAFYSHADSVRLQHLFNITAVSKPACAMYCQLNTECKSFLYDTSSNICIGYATKGVEDETIVTGTKMYYYSTQNAEYCPADNGYTYSPTYNYCYSFQYESQTWESARDICQSQNGSLIILDTVGKKTLFYRIVQGEFPNARIWIGGFKNIAENWIWLNGDRMSMSRDLWAYSEPNQHFPDEDCASFYTDTNGYFDILCSAKLYFICEI